MGARGEGGCVGELTTGADPALPPAKKRDREDRSGPALTSVNCEGLKQICYMCAVV